MGQYGNGASLEDIARQAGHSEGSVENFTSRCFDAIESLHDIFVRRLTPEEKETEKSWLDQQLGFAGSTWRDGWIMYDRTIVIGNVPSNLRIVDYSHGMTGSAHDARAFEHTAAALHPNWLFDENEFAWADSAYQVNACTIPVHKKPACLLPENILFNKTHCMGALKGRFQCLCGLHVNINTKSDHVAACRWIAIAIILHNLIIDVEGGEAVEEFLAAHGVQEEVEDHGLPHIPQDNDVADDDTKRRTLVAEIVAFRQM
ncbi:hypothetical protein FIBSPDRAFT_914037 [Athelia psychrophila]|uniref:DDE Tnp4 domain-containing protein n=1 Tax=Athelia psychrophila TaxID=1759441 RepID=A0A165YKJ8_9AGAM|nr:hypothetical protein FIBSPDRAFT_914037 [Fibularhizoctonia sp. CBS 109695]